MPPLTEQYRPRSFDDLVGQPDVKRRLDALRQRGLAGRAFWLYGTSGCGKTTAARLIAAEIADDWAVIELDALDVGIDKVRELEGLCRHKPISGQCHVFIINEAHGLSGKVISRLQTVLEHPHVQANSTWIFTTTFRGQRKLFDSAMDAEPFISRAICLEFKHGDDVVLEFALRARKIADQEGLNGKPLEAYVKLVRDSKCNLRQVLQEIEAGAMLP